MARQLTNDEMQRLALLGARSRLEALQAEARRIIADFPQLRRESRRQPAEAEEIRAPAASAGRPRRRRKKPAWSDEARRAVSERMKKYWASRRKTGAKR
jgi:hypothetical protein